MGTGSDSAAALQKRESLQGAKRARFFVENKYRKILQAA